MARTANIPSRARAPPPPPAHDRLSALRETRAARALAAHPHRTAAGLLALLVLVYLWPALIEGHVLAPLTTLDLLAPWRAYAPRGYQQFLNLSLGDPPVSYYPWDHLARQLIHAGTFPAWNPHAFAGTPLFANPEVAWLSPFSLPLWILPLNYGLGVAAALKLWTAAFGTYLLARELKLGFWPALLAGVSFALCAFNIIWLSHGVFANVSALLPWTLLLIERLMRRGRSADGLALAVVVAAILAGGHPGTQLHVLGGAFVYALVRAALRDGSRRDRLRCLALTGAGMALGAVTAAIVLLPAIRAASGTAGAAARAHGAVGFYGSDMPLSILRTALYPNWWGGPNAGLIGPANYNERTVYTGVAALVLAVVALVARSGWRRKAPFALLGAIGALAAVTVPGLHDLLPHLPLFGRVQNQRMLLWFEFAVAILAAFGLQALLDAPRLSRPGRGALAGGLVVLVAALDLLHFTHGLQPMGPASQVIPPRTPAIAFLQRHRDEGRIAGMGQVLNNDYSTVYGLHDARGYDAPQPSLRYYRLWRIANPAQEASGSYRVTGLSREALRVLSMLGTHYLIAEPGSDLRAPSLSRVYAGRDASVFANAAAMPRAIVASGVHVAGGEDAEIAAIGSSGFDPRRDAVVRRDELATTTALGGGGRRTDGGADRVHVVADESSRVALSATLAHAGLVVPAGTHAVLWRYRVPGLRLGAGLSAAGLLGMLAWGGSLIVRSRRRAATPAA